jgi:DNA-directed RNA polymerase subunit alpha
MDWSTLIRPRTLDGARGDFVCEPLDGGAGDALGRALRHALLHEVPGTAIVAVRARLAAGTPPSGAWMRALCLAASQVVVTAAETQTYARVELAAGAVVAGALGLAVVDPSQELCTAEDDVTLELWLERACGMRFGSTSREHALPEGAWPVDAFFAPVRCADFFTERPRVGPWRHLDRLLIHIETNGAISADEALWTATRALGSADRAA